MNYVMIAEAMFDFGPNWQVSEGAGEAFYHDRQSQCKLYCHDTFTILPEIPDSCVDMVFTDPPYFLSSGGITCKSGKMVCVDKGDWDKLESIEDIHNFNKRWIKQCQRILKPNGSIWICGTAHNIFSVGLALQECGYKILNDIVWEKPAPPPNLSCRYFTHAAEHLIWAAKNKRSKHTFNYELMKRIADGKQMKSVWKLATVGKDEKLFGKHPTQKPVELVRRAVLAASLPGDIILVPFCGSGTTGVVCKQEHRKFIGIDSSDEFLAMAQKRIQAVNQMRSPANQQNGERCT